MEKRLFVSAMAIFLFAICILSFFHVGNTWKLNGDFSVYEEPEFSIESYASGQFQSNMENYFSSNYTGHNFNIRIYNQIRYSVFHTANSIVIGDEGYLYESPYIAEVLGLEADIFLSDEEIQQLAEQIYMIQTEAVQQGKAFVFVFTPSKADFESESIPNRFYEMKSYYGADERNYCRLLEAFDELGVFYIDGSAILKEQEVNYPVFYKTGIHWSRVAALTVMNEITDGLNKEYNMHIRNIECTNMEEIQEPLDGQDQDLYNLLNVFYARKDSTYYWPEEKPIMTAEDELPKIFIQGGSFTNKLADISSDNRLFSELWREFYAKSIYDYNRKMGYGTENLDCDEIKQAIRQADIIMLEANVENINQLMPNMYDAIYRHLQEEELEEMPLIRSGIYPSGNDGAPFSWAGTDVLYEYPLVEGEEEIQIQLEVPLDIYYSLYGNELVEPLVVYVNGREVGEFGYDTTDINILLRVEEMNLAEDIDSVLLEIVAPYSFRPSRDLGTEDANEYAYKIRKIGGEEIGF